MFISRRSAIASVLGSTVLPAGVRAGVRVGNPVRIGVLTDMSGPFADSNGRGSVIGAQMAIDEAARGAGRPIELISADMGVSVDQAVAIGRRWIDTERVNAIVDVPSSAAALAISDYIRSRDATFLASGPGTARLTGESCSPNTVHWTFDTYAFASTAMNAMAAAGVKTWFFITADYVFGKDLQSASTKLIAAAGGQVVGSILHPINNSDFSAQLLTAQAARPDVIALASGPTDSGNVLKQASEFGMMRPGGPRFLSLAMNPLDVKATGQDITAGLFVMAPFYWDLNDRTRAFSARFAARAGGRMPVLAQAGAYGATLHYLKAVAAAGTTGGAAVVRAMKAMPTDDDAFGPGIIRADGRKLHPFYLFRVKPKAESRTTDDILTVVEAVPGEQAFRPLGEGGCPLVPS